MQPFRYLPNFYRITVCYRTNIVIKRLLTNRSTLMGDFMKTRAVFTTAMMIFAVSGTANADQVLVDQVSAGDGFSLALTRDGTVASWGDGTRGNSGNDGTYPGTVLQADGGPLRNVVEIFAGRWHGLALKSDGTVWSWGSNLFGQLGDGTMTSRERAVQVVDPSDPTGFLSNVASISGSGYASASLAVKTDGTVWTWGENGYGLLGNGEAHDRSVPGKVMDSNDPTGFLTGIVDASMNQGTGIAVKYDGTVWTWGTNCGPWGVLHSLGRTVADNCAMHTAGQVEGPDGIGFLTGAVDVEGHFLTSFVRMADGSLWGWGISSLGRLGVADQEGGQPGVDRPVQLVTISDIAGVGAGVGHGVALEWDGEAWAWGWGAYGILGDGTGQTRNLPVRILDPSDPSGFLMTAVSIDGSQHHTLAATADGTVLSFGRGPIGNGSTGTWNLVPAESFLEDTDLDQILDGSDNCIETPNPLQIDADGNQIGDACNDHLDQDGDEYEDDSDNCIFTPNPDQADSDRITFTFTKPDHSNPYDYLDCLTPEICLGRESSRPLYNFGSAGVYAIEWARGTCGAVISQFYSGRNGLATAMSSRMNDIVGEDTCMRIVGTGETLDFHWNNWSCCGFGGFSYTRWTTDGIGDLCDNCPIVHNPSQSDVDGDFAGDVCDLCPADPSNTCNVEGCAAEEVPADEGGTVETPDGGLALEIEPGDLREDMTISVTETVFNDPEVDLTLGPNSGLGQALTVYDLRPDGLVFDSPVTLTIIADVTPLNPNQRDRLELYIKEGNTFVALGATCEVVEDPPGTFVATCMAEVSHFSLYALVAPLDGDGDGVPNSFREEFDECPASDLSSTVIVHTCDTRVPNTFSSVGCSISDLVANCASDTLNHGNFVSCVAKVTNALKKNGLLTGNQHAAIQKCSAKANIP
jgi:alpha-tubulin suppressor-like RCC1 family protein